MLVKESALDVQDVAAVEEPIEQGGGHDLIARQHSRPVFHRLVCGDQEAATLVAVGNDPEDEVASARLSGWKQTSSMISTATY